MAIFVTERVGRFWPPVFVNKFCFYLGAQGKGFYWMKIPLELPIVMEGFWIYLSIFSLFREMIQDSHRWNGRLVIVFTSFHKSIISKMFMLRRIHNANKPTNQNIGSVLILVFAWLIICNMQGSRRIRALVVLGKAHEVKKSSHHGIIAD